MAGGRVVALGEVLVDFVSKDTGSEPVGEGMVPRFGGSPANIAVGAARFGARSAFLGGAGEDRWGRWLEGILETEGVELGGFRLLEGVETPTAQVTLSDGEPGFRFRGDREECVVAAAGAIGEALATPPGVFVFGSDTLIGDGERALTLRAQRLARARGWTVLYDPNLRPIRWEEEAAMLGTASGPIADATIVKANAGEAMALTGAGDSASAADAILAAGARAAVVTLGADGAVVSSTARKRQHVDAPRAEIVDATGAGDAVAAVIAAAVAEGADLGGLLAVLELAVAVASRVVGAPGALAGLPPAVEARESLRRALSG